MNVGKVQEYKLQIGYKEFTFRLDFKALMKFNKQYENAMEIFNDFLKGKNEYDCIVKILSCSCTDDLTEEFLINSLSFDFPTMKILDAISMNMIQGSLALDEKKDREEQNNEKN